MTGACKDLKERIINSKEYKDEQEEYKLAQELENKKQEISTWFDGLPSGIYTFLGKPSESWFSKGEQKKYKVKKSYDDSSMHRTELWYLGIEEVNWMLANKEKVCESIEYAPY